MIVERYWTGIARRLQIESGLLNGVIPHMLERGEANEYSLGRLVESLLPPSVGVGSGVVFDSSGNTSGQMDLILFDRASQPQLLAQTNQVMFPVETVMMTVEVKTNLSASDISTDFPAKRKKLHALKPVGAAAVPPFALFAYGFADSTYNRAKELSQLGVDERPDLACVVDPGFVLWKHDTSGFVPLRDPDAGEEGQTGWVRPKQGSTATSVTREGIEYPVFMFGQYTGDRFVGDPGRALLLFCFALLESLDREAMYAWVQAYTSASVSAVLPVS